MNQNLAHSSQAANLDVCHYAPIIQELAVRLRARAALLEPDSAAAVALYQSALDSQRSLRLHQARCPRCTPGLKTNNVAMTQRERRLS